MFIRLIREIARRKNSTDVLLSSRQDSYYTSSVIAISKVHNDPNDDINNYAVLKRTDPVAREIRYVLNQWEHISVGIQNNIYCEKILKESSGTSLVRLYDMTKIFIDTINTDPAYPSKTAYQEFKWLAKKWKNKPNKVKQ